jgi:2-hydroxychromene-2-carboxylate isomerase
LTTIDVTHFSDPGCPWAYSASPQLTALRWRFGDQLAWRNVMIGLAENGAEYEQRGWDPLRFAHNYRGFRARGMPFSTTPRARTNGTGRACRAVVATRLLFPARELAVFRALQFAWFTSTLQLDEDEGLAAALADVAGVHVAEILAALDGGDVGRRYEADRAESRTAAGTASQAQGRTSGREGAVRYTAPTLIFARGESRLEAGGWQPFAAYDVCLANLDPTLARRPRAEDVHELLCEFPDGLTTREVALCRAAKNDAPDDDVTEAALIDLLGEGVAHRRQLANGALWTAV